ncbi:MAG TPA: L-histidine N(alpha)-methyltransferase [Polyangiaceae bacterium]|nr:L-histidine N(alpha)-methyltransferase [Polyangiaceae bacterium]
MIGTAALRLEAPSERTEARIELLREVLHGLAQTPKRLPCKLFYDARGSELFERICELPEYYPTRTELGILSANIESITRALGPKLALLEYGSGASVKTRLLLDRLESPRTYVPIEISRSALESSAHALAAAYPRLMIEPLCADYTKPLKLPEVVQTQRRAAFFPGSTIGNFEPDASVEFMRRVRGHCGPRGKLLIGVDLKKDPSILEAAYDDAQGVTAAFNLNILRVLNRECRAHFPLEAFTHRAIWNERASRIEMHLLSRRRQRVQLDGAAIHFEAGEPIVTEHCYKYELGQFRELAERSGFRVERVWTDPELRFSVQLLG